MSEIPDGEILYRYVKPGAFPVDQEEIPPHIFNDPELSCDWKRYQENPDNSIQVTRFEKTYIISIVICDEIRNPKINNAIVPGLHQNIFHDPVYNDPETGDNYSHSLIKGKKKKPVQDVIKNNSTWRKAN